MDGFDGLSAPRYLPINRSQKVLQPVDVERLIDDQHAARKIWRVVEQLDLSRFETDVLAVEGRAGRCAHSPQVLVAVWLYAFSKGLHSAREIERQMDYEPGLEWLTGLRPINHHTLSDFRVGHGQALRELFEQVLAMLTMKGLITLERVAVDGTKIRAQASKKSFSRAGNIRKHLKLAREHLAELDRADAEEQFSARRKAAQRRAAGEREQRLSEALEEIERLRANNKQNNKKEPEASRSDADAHFMKVDGGLAPSYNVQIGVDGANGLIVDVETVIDPQDGQQIAPAAERLKKRFGSYPGQVLADGAYTNHESVRAMEEKQIDYYSTWTGRNAASGSRCDPAYRAECFVWDESAGEFTCPQHKRLGYAGMVRPKGRERHLWAAEAEDCRACEAREKCCPGNSLRERGRSVSVEIPHPSADRFDEKMSGEQAQAIYKRRAQLAEFPNAWIKEKFQLRRFRCRGLGKVNCEAIWAAITFDLQRMFRLAPQPA